MLRAMTCCAAPSLVVASAAAPAQPAPAAAATRHEFIFTIQTGAPYKLVSVGIREAGHFGHGGFGH
jgi:hypothetical protein